MISARARVHALRCPRLPHDALHLAVFQHDVGVILQNLLVLSEVLGVPMDDPLLSSRVEAFKGRPRRRHVALAMVKAEDDAHIS